MEPKLTQSNANGWPPRWLPIVAIAIITTVWPWVGWSAHQAWLKNRNRIEDWLPSSYPETKALNRFVDRFGSDEFLMISWEGCRVRDPQASQVAKLITARTPTDRLFIDKAITSEEAITQLATIPWVSDVDETNLEGLFIGSDGKQACVIALISKDAWDDRKGAVQWVREQTRNVTGLTDEEIHIAGTTADSVAVDEAASQGLTLLNFGSYTVCFLILVASVRRFWLIATLFVTAVFNQQLALAFIHWSGGHVDSVQLLVANLSFVLTISVGLHYLGYFREALANRSASPGLEAVKKSLFASAFAALTTSLGFLSLCTSELVPIRSFGFYSAVLVPINAAIVILLLAIHGKWASTRTWLWRQEKASESFDRNRGPVASGDIAAAIGFAFAKQVRRGPLLLITIWFVAFILLAFGVTRLKTSVGTNELLSERSKLVQDYRWLEERIGPLVPLEVVVSFRYDPKLSNQGYIERLLAIDSLQRRLGEFNELQTCFSALTFLPELPTLPGVRGAAKRAVLGKVIGESRASFREQRLLYEDDHEQSWRLSYRVPGSKRLDYADLIARVQAEVDSYLVNTKKEIIAIEIGGGVPFIYRTQRQLLLDLMSSFATAFVSIALSMAILFRSIIGGLLTMIPNVTPAAFVFGLMGWLGFEVEIGTVLTASVMMGVCVDDTLHFVSHFRASRREGHTPAEAVDSAISNCGGAMIQTAMVCGVGMLVFALSSFIPVARFAMLTFSLLMVGLISDLILTPAILLSPLNRFFYTKVKLDQKEPADV